MTDAVRRLADWDPARLRALADEHETPLYVYDLARVRANAERLLSAFEHEDVSYAVKANAVEAVLETVAESGLGAECASPGEVERALAAGFDPSDVRYTAVNPPDRDLDRAVDLAAGDLTITVGARDTYERLRERGFDGPLAVRVNPGVGAGHHEKVTTGDAPQFGVPYERAADLAREMAADGADLVGLHAHAGSGISDEAGFEAHRELVSRMGDLARDLADLDLDFLNVGGGFGVPAHPDEAPLDIEAVAAATRDAAGDIDPTLGVEPGRYVVADAGVLLTSVNTVKPTPETTVVGVDAGMTTLLRPALYDAYHEITSLEPDARDRERVSATVAGPVCETADVLGTDRDLAAPARGDLLGVGTAGAYGYEMASTYNSRPRPAAVAVDGDASGRVVRRERLADLTRLEDAWST